MLKDDYLKKFKVLYDKNMLFWIKIIE